MEYNLEAKKSLGQNFLKNTTIIKKIVEESKQYVGEKTNIIEIGPGTGELTAEILKIYPKNKVICIEADDRAIPLLEGRFEGNKNLSLINLNLITGNIGKPGGTTSTSARSLSFAPSRAPVTGSMSNRRGVSSGSSEPS